jgi:hypothetical protein
MYRGFIVEHGNWSQGGEFMNRFISILAQNVCSMAQFVVIRVFVSIKNSIIRVWFNLALLSF